MTIANYISATALDVSTDGTIYVVNDGGAVYYQESGGTWTELSNVLAKDIGVHDDQNVYALDRSGRKLWKLNATGSGVLPIGDASTWQEIALDNSDYKVAVGPTAYYLIGSNYYINQFDGSAWSLVPGSEHSIDLAIKHNTNVWHLDKYTDQPAKLRKYANEQQALVDLDQIEY